MSIVPQGRGASPSGSGQSWHDWLLSIWPDYMASQGHAPPQETSSPGVKAGANAPVIPSNVNNSTNMANIPLSLPGSQSFELAKPSPLVEDQTKPTVMSATPPKPQPIEPQAQGSSFFYGSPGTPVEQMPTSASGVGEALTNAGDVLSGVKTPTPPNYPAPNAPGIPGTHALNDALTPLLQAMGLAAPAKNPLTLNLR